MSERDEITGPYVRPIDAEWPAPDLLCVAEDAASAETFAAEIERHAEAVQTTAVGRDDALDLVDGADGVVLAADLPVPASLDLVREIRERHRSVPIVVVVADGSERVAAEAVTAGVDGYVRAGGEAEPAAAVADRLVRLVETDRARRECERATRLLSRLTEYTSDALWMFSADWSETLFINSAYEEIWGEPLAGIVEEPRTFLEGVHPADREDVIAAMEAISAGESRDLEFRVNPSEDYERWVSVHAEPATDERGEVVSVAGFTRDVTESKRRERALKQYREELERSNESLQEFAYIASHDLQEPLRMVSSYVDLLEQEYGDDLDGEAEEYMAFASEGARRMKEMINSLLEYSRVHSEAGDLAPVDANAVFADTEQDLELLIAEHGATVEVEDLPKVEADRDQLGQLFQNLVKNAIEHADEGANPRVEVTATERDGVVEFAVADNGPGIPEGREEDIFEIFTRGTSTSDADSTGIGLAVAKRIVRRHGGEIWAESDGEAGATFRFTIPAVDEDAETTTP